MEFVAQYTSPCLIKYTHINFMTEISMHRAILKEVHVYGSSYHLAKCKWHILKLKFELGSNLQSNKELANLECTLSIVPYSLWVYHFAVASITNIPLPMSHSIVDTKTVGRRSNVLAPAVGGGGANDAINMLLIKLCYHDLLQCIVTMTCCNALK